MRQVLRLALIVVIKAVSHRNLRRLQVRDLVPDRRPARPLHFAEVFSGAVIFYFLPGPPFTIVT